MSRSWQRQFPLAAYKPDWRWEVSKTNKKQVVWKRLMLNRHLRSPKPGEHIAGVHEVSMAGHHWKCVMHVINAGFKRSFSIGDIKVLSCVNQAAAIHSTVLITLEMHHRITGHCFWIHLFLVALQVDVEIESSTVSQAEMRCCECKAVNPHKPSTTCLLLLTHKSLRHTIWSSSQDNQLLPQMNCRIFSSFKFRNVRTLIIFLLKGEVH